MELESESIRLIIEDQEYQILWKNDVDDESVYQVAIYIKDLLRKSYKSDEFHFRDYELKHYELNDVVKFKVSPIYISIPHRSNVHTYNKPDKRRFLNKITFVKPTMISIQKFDHEKKLEQIEMKINTLKMMNESNKARQFDDPSLRDKAEAKPIPTILLKNPLTFVEVTKAEENHDPSPTFGTSNNKPSSVKKDEDEDLSKRQKVAGRDGKSQAGFFKLQQENKYPMGKKIELQVYTLEEVANHSSEDDAWIVINGKIYDVTKYLDYHPGGRKKLMLGVGKDGTALYNKYHPWVNANFLLEKFQVGFLKK